LLAPRSAVLLAQSFDCIGETGSGWVKGHGGPSLWRRPRRSGCSATPEKRGEKVAVGSGAILCLSVDGGLVPVIPHFKVGTSVTDMRRLSFESCGPCRNAEISYLLSRSRRGARLTKSGRPPHRDWRRCRRTSRVHPYWVVLGHVSTRWLRSEYGLPSGSARGSNTLAAGGGCSRAPCLGEL
jgi:hypothetical protein